MEMYYYFRIIITKNLEMEHLVEYHHNTMCQCRIAIESQVKTCRYKH